MYPVPLGLDHFHVLRTIGVKITAISTLFYAIRLLNEYVRVSNH